MGTGRKDQGAVRINGLNWSFGSTAILKDITLQLDKGRFTGIIGPNGSGKTTLLKNITAWLKPHRNTVFIGGRDVLSYGDRELARSIAVVSQSTRTEFDFTALEVVLMGRLPHISRLRNESSDDIRICREKMESTHTWHLRDRPIGRLSGGELQRVAIARALAQNAQILLLDEPVSHLDIRHQIKVLDMIKRLQRKEGLCIIAVFHDLNLAAQYSDLLALMHKGRIKCFGSPGEVLTRENIREVYELEVHMMKNPINGLPHIVPIPSLDTGDMDG